MVEQNSLKQLAILTKNQDLASGYVPLRMLQPHIRQSSVRLQSSFEPPVNSHQGILAPSSHLSRNQSIQALTQPVKFSNNQEKENLGYMRNQYP